MSSWNIKKKQFKEDELATYGFTKEEAELILEYQKKLPILLEDNNTWVDGRKLHKFLEVNTPYTQWFERMTEYGFNENIDFMSLSQKCEKPTGGRPSINHKLTMTMSKEISMIQRNDVGKLARKYFITIESAFKNRTNWNYDRSNSLVRFKDLQRAFLKYRPELIPSLPKWADMKPQVADFWAINDAIIGMTANNFRNANGLAANESVRNAFSERQLEYVSELEHFDADLILVHHVFDFNERHSKLKAKYESLIRN